MVSPFARLRTLSQSSAGRAQIHGLLTSLAPQLAPVEAAGYLARVEAQPRDWKIHFEAGGDAFKELAVKQRDAVPVLSSKFGSPEWYAEGEVLSRQIDAALNVLLDEVGRLAESTA
ncbi:hypothetical protein EHF33_13875 [Deinococcus psychrotolerans]|uniref:Uncharacterized protein n=1 Tax=Deinococcus psychrotolerans TaxID=2489213 RepID=A0A3G8YGQ2_9DEIO|nr:hypothetical protein [Deinococcus psychrotolerans]AZI44010.1 hypothetical protein EHF33_13875 [Deinococcus psychrotolerans]